MTSRRYTAEDIAAACDAGLHLDPRYNSHSAEVTQAMLRQLQSDLATAQRERDEFKRRLTVLRDDARKAFGLGLMPWLLSDEKISDTAAQLSQILSGWHEARAELAKTREMLAQSDAVIHAFINAESWNPHCVANACARHAARLAAKRGRG